MSVYAVHKVLYLLETDAAFLEKFRDNVETAVVGFRLEAGETAALKSGDVGALYLKGVHPFLLHTLARHNLCGLDKELYMTRVRAATTVR